MNKSQKFGVTLAAAFLTTPAIADDQENPASKDDVVKLDDKISTLAATLEGMREKDGGTVEANAGEIEAAILSASAMDAAAAAICDRMGSTTASTVYVVSDQDVAEMTNAAMLDVQIRSLSGYLDGLAESSRSESSVTNARGVSAVIGAATQLVSALGRSEDIVKPITGTITNPMVIANIMANKSGCLKGKTIFGDDSLPTRASVNKLTGKLSNLQASFDKFQATVGEKPTNQQKQVINSYGAFISSLNSGDGASKIQSYLLKSAMWDTISNASDTAAILRLSVEKSGGTLLQRENLWTALGAQAFAITAGTIVQFRLSKPNGAAISSGSIYCTTIQTNFKQLHKMGKDGVPANCRIDGE